MPSQFQKLLVDQLISDHGWTRRSLRREGIKPGGKKVHAKGNGANTLGSGALIDAAVRVLPHTSHRVPHHARGSEEHLPASAVYQGSPLLREEGGLQVRRQADER